MATRTLPFHPASTQPSLQALPRAAWHSLRAMWRARTTRRVLMEMDARMLADIGVGRGEAYHEANRPFWDIETRR